MRISPNQLCAARGLLGVKQTDVAKSSGVDRVSISRYESGQQTDLSATSFEKIYSYFDNRNIMFLENNGVSFKPEQTNYELVGQDGFRCLLDDVYNAAKDRGGNISILNGSPILFLKHLGEEWYNNHSERMYKIKENINFRIISEKDGGAIGKSFAAYKWISHKDFYNQSIYIYGSKVAFINFDTKKDVIIEVINQNNQAKTFNAIFNLLWDNIGS